jgi:predicted NBD/HSP70 family sugar kinase
MKNKKIISLKDMKRLKHVIFLTSIFRKREMTRTELAACTGINLGVVTILINELLGAKLLIEEDARNHEAGDKNRKGNSLKINPEHGAICAINILPKIITYTLYNMKLEKIEEFTVENSEEIILQKLFERLVISIDHLIQIKPEFRNDLLGIGISMPVEYNQIDQKVLLDTGVSADRMDFDDALCFKYKKPVFINPSFYSRAMAEYYLGAATNMEEFIFLEVSADIQAVIVRKGRIFRTPCLSDVIKHNVIDKNGPKCSCGKSGCLGVFITIDAIIKRVRSALNNKNAIVLCEMTGVSNIKEVDFNVITRWAVEGDHFIENVVIETAEMLCAGIIDIMDRFNIKNAVLDGEVVRLRNFSYALAEKWANYILFQSERCNITIASIAPEEINLGNGAIVLSNYLETCCNENKLVYYNNHLKKYPYN